MNVGGAGMQRWNLATFFPSSSFPFLPPPSTLNRGVLTRPATFQVQISPARFGLSGLLNHACDWRTYFNVESRVGSKVLVASVLLPNACFGSFHEENLPLL